MKFTTPCFVRIEDAEKRKELIEWMKVIGRERLSYSKTEDAPYFIAYKSGNYEQNTESYLFPALSRHIDDIFIDCEENIDMFKALSAMNDENDHEQWYIVEKKLFNKYDFSSHTMFEVDKFHLLVKSNGNGDPCGRKATAEEVIKQYKIL
jgi:hypothetical protein